MTTTEIPVDTTTTEPALKADKISIRFGGVQALDGVSLEAKAGEITGLIGPNGAGKSTALGICSGVLVPNSGEVYILGERVTKSSPQARAARAMSRSFQSPQLVKELDVREHMIVAMRSRETVRRSRTLALLRFFVDLIPGVTRGVSADERDRADRLLDELGLLEVADRGPMDLPMGMRRLVEVAQCIATDPKVLLLDEPSAGLNKSETQAFATLVQNLAKARGIAVLLVEHDLDLVLTISSRIFVIDFGKLIDSGTPAEMRASKVVQAAYLGGADA